MTPISSLGPGQALSQVSTLTEELELCSCSCTCTVCRGDCFEGLRLTNAPALTVELQLCCTCGITHTIFTDQPLYLQQAADRRVIQDGSIGTVDHPAMLLTQG